MALATKCPQCGALFRVVADQLKLRGGLVRCGQCRAVFDAIGSLTYVDDSALAQTRTVSALTQPIVRRSPPPSPAAAGANTRSHRTEPTVPTRRGPRTRPAPTTSGESRQALGPVTTLRIAPTAPATLANPALRRSAPLPPPPVQPSERGDEIAAKRSRSKRERAFQEQAAAELGVPTLIAPGGRERVDPGSIVDGIEVIELAAPPDDPNSPSSQVASVSAAENEPAFIRDGKVRERRGFSIVFGGGTLLLAAAIAVQLAVIFRAELVARFLKHAKHCCRCAPCLVARSAGPPRSINWR